MCVKKYIYIFLKKILLVKKKKGGWEEGGGGEYGWFPATFVRVRTSLGVGGKGVGGWGGGEVVHKRKKKRITTNIYFFNFTQEKRVGCKGGEGANTGGTDHMDGWFPATFVRVRH